MQGSWLSLYNACALTLLQIDSEFVFVIIFKNLQKQLHILHDLFPMMSCFEAEDN